MEPGGFNNVDLPSKAGTLYDFRSEEAEQYEFGWKGRIADGRGIAGFAVFYIDYSDRQIEFQIPNPDGGGLIEGIFNAGDSTQQGIEAEFSIKTSDYLTISGSAGFIDAEWDSGTNISGVDMSGERPPVVPNSGATLEITYDHYRMERIFLSISKLATTEALKGCKHGILSRILTIMNLQSGWSKDNWELMFNIENITDEAYYVDVQYLSNLIHLMITVVVM